MSTAAHCLLELSGKDSRRLQKDGWGVGWFADGGRPRVVKSAEPIFKESERARAAARRAVSKAVVGHVRAASNPKGLPPGSILGLRNNQPFSDGRFLFAHNGTLEIPDEIAARLGPYRKRLRSANDSEVFFWQFVKFYAAGGDAGAALAACVGETRDAWQDCRRRHPSKRAPFTGLNAVVTDGRSLHAMSLYRSAKGLRSLGRGDQPWGTMSLRAEPGRVTAASEPFDGGRWRRLPPDTIVSAVPAGRRIAVRLRRVLEDPA